jgi:hypothetical protein
MPMNQPPNESNPPNESPPERKPYETPVLEHHGKLIVVVAGTLQGGGG